MSLETCQTCGKFMSKKEIDYSLSTYGNKNCKVCETQKYEVSSTGPQKKRSTPKTVYVSRNFNNKGKLKFSRGSAPDSGKSGAFQKIVIDPQVHLDRIVERQEALVSEENTDGKITQLETQMNPFPTKNIGLLIGAIVAFFIPFIGPIVAIVLFAVWRAKSKQEG